MRYKTLFRVLLKLLGVWLIVNGVRDAVRILWGIIYFGNGLAAPFQFDLFSWSFQLLPAILQTAAGFYLFFGGKLIADLAIPGNRLYCHECGYELGRTTASELTASSDEAGSTPQAPRHCPECGTPFLASPGPSLTTGEA